MSFICRHSRRFGSRSRFGRTNFAQVDARIDREARATQKVQPTGQQGSKAK